MPVIPSGPPIAWSDIIQHSRTGDIFLFAGASWQSVVVEDFTGGPYSHVAMVVRPDMSKPPLLWQSNPTRLADSPTTGPDTHKALPEGITDGAGVQIGYLDQALNTIHNAGDTAYYRPITGTLPADLETKVSTVMANTMGLPFGSLSHMAWAYAEGQLGIDAGIESFFCSQLVTYTYQQAGLLDSSWPPNSYAPNDYDVAHTPTLLAGQLGEVRTVQIDTVPGHRSVAAPVAAAAAPEAAAAEEA